MHTPGPEPPAIQPHRQRFSTRMARTTLWLTAAVSLVVALSFPVGYFAVSYRYTLGRLDAQAQLIAQTISSLINSNPTLWRFETLRIEALLAQESLPGQGDARRILDLDGNLVTGTSHRPAWPTLTLSRDMLYAGRPVGTIEITHSLVGLVKRTALLALLGGLLGYLIFRLLPFSAAIESARNLQAMNEELEERVRERTALLEQANLELDAFSYSVSHDLRAPLRGIDGFSHALLEELGDQISPQARHYLQRIRSGTQRMGRLIDDLLRLSRVSRTALDDQELDLSAMARSILAEYRQHNPSRAMEILIEDGLAARGDPGLITVVLDNLLGNALKYTAKVPVARIEFSGARQPDGGLAFCVRDNGAGFEMAYADKLFRAFQRLHAAPEFEGSGIGLAIVKRVVHRHGGAVWARSTVAEGASFFFTLPEAS